MKFLQAFLLVLLGGLALTLAETRAAAPRYQAATVRITAGGLDPAALTVAPGTLVTWSNESATPLTLASVDGAWLPVDLPPGVTYARAFEEPGRYAYSSLPSGAADGTATLGAIVVEPALVPTPTPATTADSAPNAIFADDQLSDGSLVEVREVLAAAPGFVAIYRSDEAGTPVLTEPLGYAPVLAGRNQALPVPLDAPLPESPTTLYAALHLDGGTPGLFEFPAADPIATQNDAIVTDPFGVTLVSVGGAGSDNPDTLPEAGNARTSYPTRLVALGLALLASGGLLARRGRRAQAVR